MVATGALAGVGLPNGIAKTCSCADCFVYQAWRVSIANENKHDTVGWGLVFLDNFCGICGDIAGWTCDHEVETDNVNLFFSKTVAYDGGDITGAIKVASYQALDITYTRTFRRLHPSRPFSDIRGITWC